MSNNYTRIVRIQTNKKRRVANVVTKSGEIVKSFKTTQDALNWCLSNKKTVSI